jgi:hypothetical protein
MEGLPEGHEARPFKVLFIPDPTLSLANRSAALNDLAYIRTTITDDEFAFVSDLTGVHVLKQTGFTMKVLMQEWVGYTLLCGHYFLSSNVACQLYLMILMHRWNRTTRMSNPDRLFDMLFMNWSEYFDALNEPTKHAERWTFFASMDCIIGGVDMDIHYL